jgi:hypothetical protein
MYTGVYQKRQFENGRKVASRPVVQSSTPQPVVIPGFNLSKHPEVDLALIAERVQPWPFVAPGSPGI